MQYRGDLVVSWKGSHSRPSSTLILIPAAGPRGKPFPVLSLIFLICKIKGLNFGQIFSENTFLFPLHETPHVYTLEAQVGWCLWNLSEHYLLSWILTGHTIKAMYLSLLMSEPEKQMSQVLKTPWEVNSFSSRLWVQHQLELFSFLFDIKIPHFIEAIMPITQGGSAHISHVRNPDVCKVFARKSSQERPQIYLQSQNGALETNILTLISWDLASSTYCIDSIQACGIRVRYSKESLKVGVTYNPLFPSNF